MKKSILKALVLGVFLSFMACEPETNCETKTRCYSDGNGGQSCIEEPVPGTCISVNNYGF